MTRNFVSDSKLTMRRIPATSSTTPGMKNKRPRLRTTDLLTADLHNTHTQLTWMARVACLKNNWNFNISISIISHVWKQYYGFIWDTSAVYCWFVSNGERLSENYRYFPGPIFVWWWITWKSTMILCQQDNFSGLRNNVLISATKMPPLKLVH